MKKQAHLILKVHHTNEYSSDDCPEAGLLLLTHDFESYILKLHKKLTKLKKELGDAIYTINAFNLSLHLLEHGETEHYLDSLDPKSVLIFEEKGFRVIDSNKFAKLSWEGIPVKSDGELLHVSEFNFWFSGHVKNTSIEWFSRKIDINKMKELLR